MKCLIPILTILLTSCLSPHFSPYKYDWFIVHDTVQGYWFKDISTEEPVYIWQKSLEGVTLGDTLQLKENWKPWGQELKKRNTVISREDKFNDILRLR